MFLEGLLGLISFISENFLFLLFSIFLSFLAAFFWLIFYYRLSKKFTTSQAFLVKVFILGVISSIIALILERLIFRFYSIGIYIDFLRQEKSFYLKENFILFSLLFFFVALPEELIKFLFLKSIVFKGKIFNQIIDGIKSGIILGLGFGLIENFFYFFVFLKQIFRFDWYNVVNLFLIRFLVPTLLHSIYGGIMGYFIVLARFYKIFQTNFLKKSFFIPLFIHSFFNYFIFTPFNLINIILLIVSLLFLLKWYLDRENFEEVIIQKEEKMFLPSFS